MTVEVQRQIGVIRDNVAIVKLNGNQQAVAVASFDVYASVVTTSINGTLVLVVDGLVGECLRVLLAADTLAVAHTGTLAVERTAWAM